MNVKIPNRAPIATYNLFIDVWQSIQDDSGNSYWKSCGSNHLETVRWLLISHFETQKAIVGQSKLALSHVMAEAIAVFVLFVICCACVVSWAPWNLRKAPRREKKYPTRTQENHWIGRFLGCFGMFLEESRGTPRFSVPYGRRRRRTRRSRKFEATPPAASVVTGWRNAKSTWSRMVNQPVPANIPMKFVVI